MSVTPTLLALVLPAAHAGTWTPTSDLPNTKMSASMASFGDGRVAYLGGSSVNALSHSYVPGHQKAASVGGGPFKSGFLFDSRTKAWTSLPDMTQPRDMPGTCVITGATGSKTLYAFGGAIAFPTPPNTTMTITDTVEMLAFGSDGQPANAWKPAKSLPSARTSPSVTSLADGSGCIIAAGFSVGGPYGFQYLSDAYLFDGSAYKQLPDLAYGRSNMGIAAAGDGVYVIGGGAHDPSYYNVSYLQLTPTVGAWREVMPLNYARSFAMVATLSDPKGGGDKIVAAGGMSLIPFFDPMGSVEVYSPKEDKWTLVDDGEPGSLPSAIGFGSGAALNATHMLVAGGVGQGTSGTEALIFHL